MTGKTLDNIDCSRRILLKERLEFHPATKWSKAHIAGTKSLIIFFWQMGSNAVLEGEQKENMKKQNPLRPN